ncbi:iron-containing alcohol dehydrogenase family protein [Gloeobacter kilaueensis]|uniref:Glycerol dehydrogenase n=1 Tax=Gloeobacter kilaueensis (strain ATCC BAA-2537 / CCAP 1431/1 / ULC 316 / JS1) TaxID=1183438 RepID=U5QML9_GLOK1|nr:iron-containing alcohol dehydrogenase family protein [Gloeobacter kilaueensis]AGY58819.1 glycerol dehydrogenase [Gloeobacter kilaueensis JS1]
MDRSFALAPQSVVAPGQIRRGRGTVGLLGEWVRRWGSRPLVIGGPQTLERWQETVTALFDSAGLQAGFDHYGIDCTEQSAERLVDVAARHDVIVGLGGGKALDMAKLVASRAQLPVIAVPTSAATCAGWAPLSNIYSEAGMWLYGVELDHAPEGLLIDYDLIATAPVRTLISGMGDALAKWYEASVSSGESDDPLVISAVQQARVLRDLILLLGGQAVREVGGRAWEQMVDASICLAGVVGGLGGARCRTVAAHAIHNALTSLPATRRSLHGEKVALGILLQLRLEENVGRQRLAGIAREQLEQFYREVGLPLALADLQLGSIGDEQLYQVAELCCRPDSDIHHLPFEVNAQQVFAVLRDSSEQPVYPGWRR